MSKGIIIPTHWFQKNKKKPYHGGYEIYNFGRCFQAHHYFYTEIFWNLQRSNQFHYMTKMVRSLHRKPRPWRHKIYSFSKRFHAHHYYILILTSMSLGVDKQIFFLKICINLTVFAPKLRTLRVGVIQFFISGLRPLQMLIYIVNQI